MSISSAVVYVCPTLEFETLSTQTRNADRSSLLRSLIHAIGLDHHCNQIFSRKARRSEAALAHTQDYLKLLRTLSRRAERKAGWQVTDSSDDEDDTEDALHHSQDLLRQFEAGLVDDCPIFPGVWDLAMFTVGGAVAGAEQLMLGKTSVACWFEGGRHHAAADSAHGFCYLNDAVVASKVLLSSAAINKVLYIDIDIHHGDGVETAFLYSNNVATLSLHLCEPGFYPNTSRQLFATQGTTKQSAIRIPLRRGMQDNLYTATFIHATTSLYAHYRPDAIILQCGVDGICNDPLGGFNLTNASFIKCIAHVLSFNKPTLILGGGGYNPANAARVWADVLETCIQTCAQESKHRSAQSFAPTSRDIPLSDDFFDRYGPFFTRDISPSRLKDENTLDELRNLLDQIDSQLRHTSQPNHYHS